MIDKGQILAALEDCKRVGDTFFVPSNGLPSGQLRQQVGAILNEWGRTYGVETGIVGENEHGIECMIAHIKSGSPKRSRVGRPWFGLAVNESRFISDKEMPVGQVRVYVSQFCAKLGQTITVAAKAGGCTITRKK